MDDEQNRQESSTNSDTDEAISLDQSQNQNRKSSFDCNICLESAHDPVVTLCGHLYCWSCIYKWLHIMTHTIDSGNQAVCPVCKSNISLSSLVPLYGRGSTSTTTTPFEPESNKPPQLDLPIPPRPQALTTSAAASVVPSLHERPPQYLVPPFGNYTPVFSSSSLVGPGLTSYYNPTVGMVGEMVFARMFGSSDASLFAHPNLFWGVGSPRLRRQEMQVEKSLSRVTIFLLCCFVLCLVFF